MRLDLNPTSSVSLSAHMTGLAHCSITSVGVVANQQLNSVQQGSVIAVFERCFYVETSSDLFCVGLAELGRGPLNALLDSKIRHLPFTIKAGEAVRIFDGQIIFDDRRIIDASSASVYQCERNFTQWTVSTLLSNREALRLLSDSPNEGFYWLIHNADYRQVLDSQSSALQSALCLTTKESIQGLFTWLKIGFGLVPNPDAKGDSENSVVDEISDMEKTTSVCQSIDSVHGLLGAGPGLTPAGDDVIAGVLLALHRFQRVDLCVALWQALRPHLSIATNTISATHLEQASQGHCSESMVNILDTLFNTEPLEAATMSATLNSMGCTSGWDTLGGIAMVLDAWQYNLNKTHRTVTTC